MQNTYKGYTAAKIVNQMTADANEPATYWVTVAGVEYRVVAHRDTVEMGDHTYASTLVLETPDDRIVLRWDGDPSLVASATVRS